MPFQVGSACYGTAQQAAQAAASEQAGSVVMHGTTAYVIDVRQVTESAITYALNPVSGGAPYQVTSSYTALPCNLMSASDGLEMGWMVGGAWLLVYGLMFIGRTLWKVENTNDGDA